MYLARNTPIKTCSGIIQPSIVYLKNQRIQNNEHVYMYKYMFKCTDYYMNQSILCTCSRLKKHSNTIMYIVQVF